MPRNVPESQSRHAQASGTVFTVEDDDDNRFPMCTQDGLLFAAIDLEFGDGDLGRPID